MSNGRNYWLEVQRLLLEFTFTSFQHQLSLSLSLSLSLFISASSFFHVVVVVLARVGGLARTHVPHRSASIDATLIFWQGGKLQPVKTRWFGISWAWEIARAFINGLHHVGDDTSSPSSLLISLPMCEHHSIAQIIRVSHSLILSLVSSLPFFSSNCVRIIRIDGRMDEWTLLLYSVYYYFLIILCKTPVQIIRIDSADKNRESGRPFACRRRRRLSLFYWNCVFWVSQVGREEIKWLLLSSQL